MIARAPERGTADPAETIGEEGPEWVHRVVDRSLLRSAASARSRGIGPASRIVDAAMQIVGETEGSSFSVQHVADRANVALQTFYRHFGSKDTLLLALLEESIRSNIEPMRERCLSTDDPLEQLHRIVTEPLKDGVTGSQYGLAIIREHFRLMSQFPLEVERAISPYTDLLTSAMYRARDTGQIASTDIPADAQLIVNLVLYSYHRMRLGALTREPVAVAAQCWDMCRRALAVLPEP